MCSFSNNNLQSKFERIAHNNIINADEEIQVFSVDTVFEKTPQSIDMKDIKTQSDLLELKKKDPFMYYSLPGVRKGDIQGSNVNLSGVVGTGKSRVVRRRSSISFESHCGNLDMDDLFKDMASKKKTEGK